MKFLSKSQRHFFRNREDHPEIHMYLKGPQWQILEKSNKVAGLTLLISKIFAKPQQSEHLLYCLSKHKDMHKIGQTIPLGTQIVPCIYGQVIIDKNTKIHNSKTIVCLQKVLRKLFMCKRLRYEGGTNSTGIFKRKHHYGSY
jgi:hypothetical protein